MKSFGFSTEMTFVKARSAKEAEKGEFVLWAYASTYDVDSDETQITREALEGAKNDLLEYSTVLFNHDMDRPVGRVTETKIDNRGLLVKIVLSNTEEDLIAKVKDGTLSKLSIMGRVMDYKFTTPDANGREILQITKLKLFEVSIVTVPANKEAETVSASVEKAFKKSIDINEDASKKNDEHGATVNKGVLQDLELLAGRLDGKEKEIVDNAIEVLRTADNEENMEKEYKFSDDAIFQVNLSDEKVTEIGDSSNQFRKQILKFGKVYHWGGDNGVLNITKESVREMVKNFKAGLLDKVSVPLTHTNDPAANAGEVVKLIETEDGLDAVIEIKDDSIAEKIRKGLITAISASFDPNYTVKSTNAKAGAVLLHAALVAEPYLKGMGEFIQLSDEFEGKEVVQFEDSKEDVRVILKSVFELLTQVQKKLDNEEVKDETEETEDQKEESDDVEKSADTDVEEETKDEKDDTIEEEEIEKSSTEDSSEESEDKEESKDEPESEEDEEEKSAEAEKEKGVDFSDSEKMYKSYLKSGQIVPAQKKAFIALCDSLKTVELSDASFNASAVIDNFIKSQPAIVNFDEDGTSEGEAPIDEEEISDDSAEMPADVKDFYINRMQLSEDAAIEAWKDAREQYSTAEEQSTLFE